MSTQTADLERVVRDCSRYWKRTGVPRDRIAEMRAELEAHLREAVSEGRSVESVVGRDPSGFAEEWAREFRPPVIARSGRRAWGPALLALLTGLFSLYVTLMTPVFSSGSVEVCCPRRVLESSREVDAASLFFAWAMVGVVLLSMTAALLLALGRLNGGSIVLGVAAVVAMFTPLTWLAAIALLACFAWTRWHARSAAPAPAGGG